MSIICLRLAQEEWAGEEGCGCGNLRLRVYLCPTGKLFMSSSGAPFTLGKLYFGCGGNVNYETESIFNREIGGELNRQYTVARNIKFLNILMWRKEDLNDRLQEIFFVLKVVF